jgi:hypothetical protein
MRLEKFLRSMQIKKLEETPPPQAPTETRNSFWSGEKVFETTTISGQMRLEKFLRSMQL